MNKTDIKSNIEFYINTAQYDAVLNLLDNEEYKSLLPKEDAYFYKSYCLCKLEDASRTNEILQCFIKILEINNSIIYKNAIIALFREIYLNDILLDINCVKEFVNELRKLLSPDDIFFIKIFHYLYWMGFYSPEEYIENIEPILNVNKSNPELYEIKAKLYSEWDKTTAINNLQIALLLNKNGKQRYLNWINELKMG